MLIGAVSLPIAFSVGRQTGHKANNDQTSAASALNSSALQDTITAGRQNAIVLASQRVAPAVVSVNVVKTTAPRPQTFFDMFFYGRSGPQQQLALGSGFVIREDGLVVTNDHVVHGATEVVVTLSDGRDYPAEVLGTDEITDIALLRLKGAEKLPVAPLGTSKNLIIGEWAIAIGNPFGFSLSNAEPSVTAGVISGVGRNIVPGDNQESGMYVDMIQTDASINPGNSGGPLVNALGEVIGVNSSIISTTEGSVGLGFAVPIDRARRIADDLLANGTVRRAWVGVSVDADRTIQAGQIRHVRITRVAPGSPAANAGLRAGMEILSVSGRRIGNPLDWAARMIDARVGNPIQIVVTDESRQRTVEVKPQDVPSLAAARVRALSDQFELVSVTPAIRSERRIRSEEGALIVKLSDEARAIGLQEGDVIVEVNRAAVKNAEDAARYMQQLSQRRSGVRLGIERNGQLGYVDFSIS